MLEWLKEILGERYTQEIDTAVSKAVGERFVSKADFNVKKDAVKDLEAEIILRDTKLEALKNVDGKGLQDEITRLQGENKAAKEGFDKQLEQLQFDHALEAALTAAHAKHPKAAQALLDLKSLKLKENGIEGLESQIEDLKKTEGWLFAQPAGKELKGVRPAESGSAGTQDLPEQMDYDALCTYLQENPGAKLG